ncbi:MAG: S-adenosylmethionine:tRNA ribosyltransferase-isomerase [Microgenomates group bacterium]
MLLTDFNYNLPPELIAQEQAVPRDSARLMLINRQTGHISHHHVYDLPSLLPKDYFIVANNTKVFPARLIGHKSTGGKVEILLTRPLGHSNYLCIARPGLKVGDIISFSNSLSGTILEIKDIERKIHFNQEESVLRTSLSELGTMPTPPYIKKLLGNSADYQTIYAKYGFSAAAPTAGLHFTTDLLAKVKSKYDWHELTLNVGLGTFLPVKENEISDHHMHAESYTISPSTAANINHLKLQSYEPCNSNIKSSDHSKQGYDLCNKLLAIGTTTMRALESNAALSPSSHSSELCELQGSELCSPGSFSTSIFIYPPYQFKLTDALMTNFHLPGSTLLMLVSAFCSAPQTDKPFTTFKDSLLGRAYAEAIREKYRFFSFGDAMLII